jgi:hypothetical protein
MSERGDDNWYVLQARMIVYMILSRLIRDETVTQYPRAHVA